ncbi:MAG: hypothetical protein HY209_02960 [Candidatus Omnitrophica bacterium]|nr:hypothetical protein [Candidatus Omnitrophota bacterium]
MIAYLNRHRGQSTLEYAVLIIIIIAALLSIQIYIKRGVQGRLKSSADDIGDQFSPGNTNVLKAEKTKTVESQQFGITGQGVQNSTLLNKETTNSATQSVVVNNDQEYWGQ